MVALTSTLGLIAVALALASYVPYYWQMLRGVTKPHAFSWLGWGLLSTTAFVAQIISGGGAGAWVTGITALLSFGICAYAFFNGERDFARFDWFALGSVLVAIVLWRVTSNPLLAVIFVSIGDSLGYLPTLRKAYTKPFEETVIGYAISSVKWLVALFALESFTPTTALYPLCAVLSNGAFALFLFVRRRQVGRPGSRRRR